MADKAKIRQFSTNSLTHASSFGLPGQAYLEREIVPRSSLSMVMIFNRRRLRRLSHARSLSAEVTSSHAPGNKAQPHICRDAVRIIAARIVVSYAYGKLVPEQTRHVPHVKKPCTSKAVYTRDITDIDVSRKLGLGYDIWARFPFCSEGGSR